MIDLNREQFEKLTEIRKIMNENGIYFMNHSGWYEARDFKDFEYEQYINGAWYSWQARVPEGYKVVKKSQLIGNQNADWSQAPEWANYWLKDGHSDKFWWSKSRPVKDNDLGCFVWGSGYMAEEAPSFGFTGAWDKSMTSKKAMIKSEK